MKFKELLPEYSGKVSDDELSSVALNSQEISKGDLYISIAKDISLQKKYCQEALKNGASFALTNNPSIQNIPKKIIFVFCLGTNSCIEELTRNVFCFI